MSLSDQLASAALVAAIVGILVSLAALLIAVIALRRADENASVAAMLTLNAELREGWRRFVDAESGVESSNNKEYSFAELMNVYEIACSALDARKLTGVSYEIVNEQVSDSLKIILRNADARSRIEALRSTPTTWKYVQRYVKNLDLDLSASPRFWQAGR